MASTLTLADTGASLDTAAAAAEQFFSEAWSERTRDAYRAQWAYFCQWCDAHSLEALPAAPQTVASYLGARANEGRKVATLELALAAIGHAHREAGHASPREHRAVQLVMRGIRRKLGVAPTRKAALLADDLRALAKGLPDDMAGVRDRALLLLGFAGAFRRSELAALELADLSVTRDGLVVTLRRSKTDQEGIGREVPIAYGRARATCPVRSVAEWIERAGITEGPLFRSVGKHGDVRARALRGADVAAIVKRRVEAAGLDPASFSGHSLRAGFVTSAARAGKSTHSIMQTTGHASVAMVARYVRSATLFDDHAGEGLL